MHDFSKQMIDDENYNNGSHIIFQLCIILTTIQPIKYLLVLKQDGRQPEPQGKKPTLNYYSVKILFLCGHQRFAARIRNK